MKKTDPKVGLYTLVALVIVLGIVIFAVSQPPRPSVQDVVSTPVGENVAILDQDVFLVDGSKIEAGTRYDTRFNPSRLLPGGPPKDGIPSIDNPKFESAEAANAWLPDDAFVLGLDFNGVVKAYPIRILNWHEIVNDFAGDKPVLVTFCPLCSTGIAFEPIIEGERVEFGTSGKLFNSDLVMYDRKTESYWIQAASVAILGPLAGMELTPIPVARVQWGDWKAAHPETLVLSRDTGFIRNYDVEDIYGLDAPGFDGIGVDFTDTRLPSNVIVHGATFDGVTKAYEEGDVQREVVINDVIGNTPVVVWWDQEINAVKIFVREVDGEVPVFSESDGKIVDDSGREWTFDGESDNLRLTRLPNFGHFWFAWAAFFPDTELYI